MATAIRARPEVVAGSCGMAHCQPMASWASMASPKVRNAAAAPPSVARLARA